MRLTYRRTKYAHRWYKVPSRCGAKAWLLVARGSEFDPLPVAHSPYPAAGIRPDAAQGHNRMAGAACDPQIRSPQFLHISALGCPRYPKIIIASSVNRWFPQYLHNSALVDHDARRAACARVRARSFNARDTRRSRWCQASTDGFHNIYTTRRW